MNRRNFVQNAMAGALLSAQSSAAPQAASKKMIGIQVGAVSFVDEGVNPVLDLSEEEQHGPEGCLSLPGLSIDCKRALHVVARGFDMHGEPVTIEGSELLARAIQHETDHLDGILFLDRLDREARREAMRIVRESEWFGEPAPVVRFSPHTTRGLGL